MGEYQSPLITLNSLVDLREEFVVLTFDRSDDDFGVYKACRSDDLLHDLLLLAQFVRSGSG